MLPKHPRGKSAYAGVVVPKSQRKTVVSLDAARLERGRRVEREEATGERVLLMLVIPTPDASRPEDRFPLKPWAEFPKLAEPVAHALLECLRTCNTSGSCRGTLSNAKYFVDFLVDTLTPEERHEFTLADLGNAQTNAFIKWLDRTDPETKTAVFAVQTRRRALGGLRSLVDALKTTRWSGEVGKTLQVRSCAWPGGHRQAKLAEVIHRDEFGRLYRACSAEIEQVIAKFDEGRRLIESSRDHIPERPVGRQSYKDLGIRLAAIERESPGLLSGDAERSSAHGSHRLLLEAVNNYGGYNEHARYFYPAPRSLVPFVIVLAAHTTYNPETILTLTSDRVSLVDVIGTQRVVIDAEMATGDDGDAPKERQRIAAPKGRAKRALQARSFPVTADSDNPALLLDFLKRWTERIRPLRGQATQTGCSCSSRCGDRER